MWLDEGEKRVLNIAHRGASGVAPENTLSAFKKAIEAGCDLIEFDVHQTKDGEVIVIHDKNLKKTTREEELVEDHSLSYLKKLDVGSWFSPEYSGEKIPTLEEVLALTKGKVGVNIEIKKGRKFYPTIEEKIVALLEKYDPVEPCIITSFHYHCLEKIKKLNPYLAIGKLLVFSMIKPQDGINLQVSAVHPYWLMVNKWFVRAAHREHLRVNVWTVNHPPLMKWLIKSGVDGIITNYPERLNWVMKSIADCGLLIGD